MVITRPCPLFIERNDEQVGAIEASEHRAAVPTSSQGVTQRSCQSVKHRGVQEEFPSVAGLVQQHLVDQVVKDEAMSAGEGADETRDIGPPSQGQRNELEPCDPTLSTGLQHIDV